MPVCSPQLLAGRPPRRNDFALLENTPILCADGGDEWDKWLASSGRPRLALGPRHYLGNALTAIEMSAAGRSEEHTSELQSLMRISYAVFCLNKTKTPNAMTLEQSYLH